MNPFQMMMGFMRQVSEAQKNPSVIPDLLLKRGAIDRDTFEQIQGKSPSQIGEYLMNKGLLNENQAQEIYQSTMR